MTVEQAADFPSSNRSDSATGVRAIVAGHGTFAVGVISAVQQITGRGDVFVAVTNTGLCLDDIESSIGAELDRTGARVLFTDLPAGSCTMAVRRMLRTRGDVVLVTGANLPLLLDFAMQEEDSDIEALRASLERGRASMMMHQPVATAVNGGKS